MALDGNVVDIAPTIEPDTTHYILLNDHVDTRWTRQSSPPYKLNWELRIEVHDDQFTVDGSNHASRVTLSTNKVLGFMLAYCDNDGTNGPRSERESFIGSHHITPVKGDKNLGYKTADVFGKIKLVGPVLQDN